jgi:hypothetical protein
MILEGEADYRSYPLGGTMCGRIAVPQNNTLIVVGFLWANLSDNDDSIDSVGENINHMISFSSKDKTRKIMMRSIVSVEGGAPMLQVPAFDVYTSDLFVTVSKSLAVGDWVALGPPAPIPSTATIPKPSLNMGTEGNGGIPFVQAYRNPGATGMPSFRPLGKQTALPPPEGATFDGFEWNLTGDTVLNDPLQAAAPEISFPIINVQTVMVRRRIDGKIG